MLAPCICTAYLQKRWFCRSGTDAAGSTQQQVCKANLQSKIYTDVYFGRGWRCLYAAAMFLHSKNSQPANVHGCTFAGKASALSLVQRSTSVYFAEHKFDRCQTCFCLIRAASVPLLKMLDVQQVRLRFISARLLASAPPICKSVGKAQLLRAAHKLILNVAERTGMSVVISSSDVFAQQKLAFKN